MQAATRPHKALLATLSVVAFLRTVLFILGGSILTLWLVGDDSWFEDPLPSRGTVFLIVLAAAGSVLLFSGLIWLGSTRLSEAERAQLSKHIVWWVG